MLAAVVLVRADGASRRIPYSVFLGIAAAMLERADDGWKARIVFDV
jgi:hypothetical protein